MEYEQGKKIQKVNVSQSGIFWCFAPCSSSMCEEKKETEKCRDCKLRAWEYEDE